MLSFKDWLHSTPIYCNDKDKACLDKIAADKDFPHSVQLWVMLNYLEEKYSKKEIGIFETYYFQEYIKHITCSSRPF